MWSHIGQIERHKDSMDFLPSGGSLRSSLTDLSTFNRTEGHKQALVMYADCSSSTKGMFGGLVVLVVSVIWCIVVNIVMDDCNFNIYIPFTQMVMSIILLLMIIASIVLYTKVRFKSYFIYKLT